VTAGDGSSSTSWRTSTSSSTSEAARLGGLIRLLHPFPSLLVASATGAIAILASGDLATAGRLAASMLCIQASIGALNDLVDAPLDAGHKPGKPIPRGLVAPRTAGIVAGLAGLAGLGLSAPSGVPTLAVAGVALGLGYVYDLGLSRTFLSWLPLALALPVVPIHAWLGSTGSVPPGLITLLPAALLAGLGLALGNGLVDVERDAATGRQGLAVLLGPRTAWLVQTGSLGLAVLLAAGLAPQVASSAEVLGALRSTGLPVGGAALALGAAALLARSAGLRERGWELEAVGVAAVGIAWLAGTAASASSA
jgi:4-hydroxybenzoate polyprenyltransferase